MSPIKAIAVIQIFMNVVFTGLLWLSYFMTTNMTIWFPLTIWVGYMLAFNVLVYLIKMLVASPEQKANKSAGKGWEGKKGISDAFDMFDFGGCKN